MSDQKTVVEIGGVKLEVDLSDARIIHNLKVGDPVKVLLKNYSGYSMYAGVIVDFVAFQKLPSIRVAYVETSYVDTKISFIVVNAESKDIEVVPTDASEPVIERGTVLDAFDRMIAKKRAEAADLDAQRAYFIKSFGKHFQQCKVAFPTTELEPF